MRPGLEAVLSLPSFDDIEKTWVYTFTPPYVFMA
jgi:hypothetical protein